MMLNMSQFVALYRPLCKSSAQSGREHGKNSGEEVTWASFQGLDVNLRTHSSGRLGGSAVECLSSAQGVIPGS